MFSIGDCVRISKDPALKVPLKLRGKSALVVDQREPAEVRLRLLNGRCRWVPERVLAKASWLEDLTFRSLAPRI